MNYKLESTVLYVFNFRAIDHTIYDTIRIIWPKSIKIEKSYHFMKIKNSFEKYLNQKTTGNEISFI